MRRIDRSKFRSTGEDIQIVLNLASGGGAAIFHRGPSPRGIRERRSGIQLDSSPILPRLRHFRSRLRNQNKSTRARNPASYAGYSELYFGLNSEITLPTLTEGGLPDVEHCDTHPSSHGLIIQSKRKVSSTRQLL